MKCGCVFAVNSIAWYVGSGITAQSEFGVLTWRRRQIASISLFGRLRVLGMSRKELRVLMPGVVGGMGLDCAAASAGVGGGGGGANGEVDAGEGGGLSGISRVGIGIAAFFFRLWILSL